MLQYLRKLLISVSGKSVAVFYRIPLEETVKLLFSSSEFKCMGNRGTYAVVPQMTDKLLYINITIGNISW